MDSPLQSRPPVPARPHVVASQAASEDPRLTAWIEERAAAGGPAVLHVAADNAQARLHTLTALAEGADAVLAAGGDGTVNAVVNALLSSPSRAVFGLLPLGTANDAALSLGLPDDPAEVLRALDAGELLPRALDVGRCNDQYFLNVASIGASAAITRDTPPGLKRLFGGLAYVAYGLTHLGAVQPFRAHVTGPDLDWSGEALAIYVGNGEYAGGGFRVCPDARPDDGALDVLLVPAMDLGNLIALAGDATVGGDARAHEFVEHHRLAAVRIEVDGATAVNLDGEGVEGHGALAFSVRPAALQVLLPPS